MQKKNESKYQDKDFTNIYKRFVCSNLKLEASQIIVEYSNNAILLSNKKDYILILMSVWMNQNNHAEQRSQKKIVIIVWFCLHKIIGN